jgi:hypothetical protein
MRKRRAVRLLPSRFSLVERARSVDESFCVGPRVGLSSAGHDVFLVLLGINP